MNITGVTRIVVFFMLSWMSMVVQAEGSVVFNEGTITGTVRVGAEELRSVTIIARSGSLESRQVFYPGSDPTVINYSLPVNVPMGESLRYRVYAYALYFVDGDRADFYSHYSDVADGATVNADFVIDNPGYIEGDLAINGGELGYATLYFRGNGITYRARASKFNNNHYRIAVKEGISNLLTNSEVSVAGSAIFRPFSSQPVEVLAGETTIFNLTYDVPLPTVIQGYIDMPGPVMPHRHNCQLLGPGVSHGKYAPCEYDVGPGTYWLRALTYFNHVDDRFYHPIASYSSGSDRVEIATGDTATFNISSDQAFIDGTLEINGAATNADLAWGYVSARGTSEQTQGGESYDYAITDGVFDLIVSPGAWEVWRFGLGFLRESDTEYLNSYMNPLWLGQASSKPSTVNVGMTENVGALNIELGKVIVNYRTENGATFSNPLLLGGCAKRDAMGEIEHFYSLSARNSNVVDVTNAQVSFVGLAGECSSIRAYATVNGARVIFGTVAVTVDPGVTKTVDLGAPTLTVESPEPNIITSNSSINVSGKATDDIGVASITVDGLTAVLQSTNSQDDANEISFGVPLELARGSNTIVTVASDDAGKQATDTRVIYRDEALPTISFTPLDSAITTEFNVVVEGLANDDAGVADVKVNGASLVVSTTGNVDAPNEVSFSSAMTLVLGENTINVVVTDISDRITTVVHKITVVENRSPVANAGPDMTLSCTNTKNTAVTLDGSGSSDPDGDALTYNWTGDFGGTSGVISTVSLPLGASDLALTVDDGLVSNSDSITVNVKVNVAGLLSPLATLVDEGNEPMMPNKAFKHGRVLPLKLELECGGVVLNEGDVAAPAIVSIVPQGETPVDLVVIDPDAGEANDNGLQFRFADPQWVYNLNTTDLMPGTVYDLTISMPDGRNLVSRFALK